MRRKRPSTDSNEPIYRSPIKPGTLIFGKAISTWTELKPGDQVVIVFPPGFRETAGEVDVVSDDGGLLWIYGEAGQGRILLHKSDKCLVWRKPVATETSSAPYPRDT